MNKPLPFTVIDPSQVFMSSAPPTMARIQERVATEMTGTKRRDSLSAFNALGRALKIDWATVRATPTNVRNILGGRSGAELGFTEFRWRNIRSLIHGAVKAFSPPLQAATQRIPLSQSWEALLAKIGKKHWRFGLNRFACYCSALQIAPAMVTPETLLGFHDALVAEELIRDPRSKLKHTIACWNMCQSNTPGWPAVRLASPFESTAFTLPRDVFPASFNDDVDHWKARLLDPDVLDPHAPPRPLKQVTVETAEKYIYRFASALVHRGECRPEDIDDLSFLVSDPERFKSGLRYFIDRNDGKASANISRIANTLRAVAKYYLRLPAAQIDALDVYCNRLRVPRRTTLTDSNRGKLQQFDDPENVRKLLAFPSAEAARGRRHNNPYRAAKCFERALATSLLISTSLRFKNLRSIELSGDLQWAGDVCYLSIPADRVKNEVPLDYELPPETCALLREFIDTYRPRFPGSDGIFLFPGRNGGPRPHNSLADGLMLAILKHTGLRMNPHLFRHVVAKIVIERDPGLAFAISRHLGHKRMETTMQSYLGTEGRVVSRRIDQVLSDARKNPIVPKD
jgi:integrase